MLINELILLTLPRHYQATITCTLLKILLAFTRRIAQDDPAVRTGSDPAVPSTDPVDSSSSKRNVRILF